MQIRDVVLYGTTDADGDLTINGHNIAGQLLAIEWIDGDLADGVDVVITMQTRGNAPALTLLSKDNVNSDAWYYPRTQMHDTAGAAVTYDGTRVIYDKLVITGSPRMVISNGGNAKTGGCTLYYHY